MVGFENTIRTGETDESLIQQIGERAIYLVQRSLSGIPASDVALPNR